MNPDLSFALELADIADRIALERFRASNLVVKAKPDMTLVSEADQSVERALRDQIARARPQHGVLGEEFGAEGSTPHRWILDPIDGTHNYVRGVPVWATLIALEQEGVMQVGVVSAPALGRRWWAARGEGAFVNGKPAHVSKVSKLSDAQVLFDGYSQWEQKGFGGAFMELGKRAWRTRGFGDFWQHMLVAEGSADLALEPVVNLWDLAPLWVILEEAGGRFTDFSGHPHANGGSAVSSNGQLHKEALVILGSG